MNTEHRLLGWERYPAAFPPSGRWIDDVNDLQEQLEQNSKDLFVDEPSKVHLEASVIVDSASAQNRSKNNLGISSITGLETFLKASGAMEDGESKFFFISKRNSWTRLKISIEVFKMLCHFYRVFPRYVDSVLRFNTQISRTEEYLGGGCYRHVREDKTLGLERKSSFFGNWMIRGRVDSALFIRRSRDYLEWINSAGEDLKCWSLGDHPLVLHLLILVSCEKNWGPYIGYLGNVLSSMNQKISFLRGYAEYNLNLSHCQRIAQLRGMLETALLILESNLDIAAILAEHASDLYQGAHAQVPLEAHEHFRSEVQQYERMINCHIRNTRKHLRFAEAIHLLTLKIMDFRNDELLQENTDSMRVLAGETVSENKAMVTIANKSAADSRTVTIATVIALIYVPVSLVTSFFSTSLVKYGPERGGASAVEIRKEIWVFIVVAVVLMVFTMVAAYLFARRQKNRDQPQQPA
ncbi:hypothetical protein FN846DRAFT_908089 [Sphaerosporella brunnea]|uniref:CorA-like transporter domain-containing protein n=1 Tax=Sphaerosporella brunnea TaxID=1250544 RepID=A0A5J5EU82_9PEZI|nr:hypothetical protein FN846DRAFT_908089 [Sphaerosporella brunnea]